MKLLSVCLCLAASAQALKLSSDGIDYHNLPGHAVFPGPWDEYIKAPTNKSFITPARIWKVEGNVTTSDRDPALKHGRHVRGSSILVGEGGQLSLEFAENIAGR
jgi:hypothetical protein